MLYIDFFVLPHVVYNIASLNFKTQKYCRQYKSLSERDYSDLNGSTNAKFAKMCIYRNRTPHAGILMMAVTFPASPESANVTFFFVSNASWQGLSHLS